MPCTTGLLDFLGFLGFLGFLVGFLGFLSSLAFWLPLLPWTFRPLSLLPVTLAASAAALRPWLRPRPRSVLEGPFKVLRVFSHSDGRSSQVREGRAPRCLHSRTSRVACSQADGGSHGAFPATENDLPFSASSFSAPSSLLTISSAARVGCD